MKYKQQKLAELNGLREKSKITVEDFNTFLSGSDKTTGQKFSKQRGSLNNRTNNQ